jgi:hypothetical protein
MNKRSGDRKFDYRVILIVLGILLIPLLVFVYTQADLLLGDAKSMAAKKAEEDLYLHAAYSISSLSSTLETKHSVEELQQLDPSDDSISVRSEPARLLSPSEVGWNMSAMGQGDATVFLSHEVVESYGCFVLSADVVTKSVQSNPVQCSHLQDPNIQETDPFLAQLPANGKEVLLNADRIKKIRATYNDNPKCYPNLAPRDVSYTGPRWYECK